MKITVHYFAAVRERLGRSQESFEFDNPVTMEQFWEVILDAYPLLIALKPHVRVAVNEAFIEDEYLLGDGDVVALIPPVSGGDGRIRVMEEPIQMNELTRLVHRQSDGALVTFMGTVRDHNEGRKVSTLEYEVYESMALKQLEKICEETQQRWPDCAVAVWHRYGLLQLQETAVAVAVSSPHRKDAFAACQYLIDRVKEDVPIWKREVGPDGVSWVGLGS